MKKNDLSDCPLFAGIHSEHMEELLQRLEAVRRSYPKEAFIFNAGSKAALVGVVLHGGVRVIQEDFWGQRMILAHIGPNGIFGEAFACTGIKLLPVSVSTAEETEVLLLRYQNILISRGPADALHTQLVENMMHILAEKNILLTRKLGHLSKRSTRKKLLSFLSAQALQQKSSLVSIPFNRQELADYLCVDRSALSRELGAMQDEGLLRYTKNRFELLRAPAEN